MENSNCDEMINMAVYGDRMHAIDLSIKDDQVVCPKARLLTHSKTIIMCLKCRFLKINSSLNM